MKNKWLTKFVGTSWRGNGELWLDPLGNNAELYECDLQIKADAVEYSWSYQSKTNKGRFTFNENGAVWTDSWHQPTVANCVNVPDAWGLFTVTYSYEVPSNPRWGWRSKLSERPDGSLVLQMVNIAPWGEEARAVRMVFTQ